ncbi:unnamed protein product [Linum tenue]|uniref:Uncharacterized protein n=1 Tax=Linum tenue TaxID=586396 RepID=A0AAV0LC70_9ROSI|nr:unnamed protein product [Linum tenue]
MYFLPLLTLQTNTCSHHHQAHSLFPSANL